VPKCKIFDRSDFHDFYTIKSLWEEDFGLAIIFLYLKVHLAFGASKFLMRMPSQILMRIFFEFGKKNL
jgi:hypothetical protein